MRFSPTKRARSFAGQSALAADNHKIPESARPRRSRRQEDQKGGSTVSAEDFRNSHLPSPESDEYFKDLKRKRVADAEALTQIDAQTKKARVNSARSSDRSTPSNEDRCNPVEYWAEHETWPRNFANIRPQMDNLPPTKRSRQESRSGSQSRSSSYAQGVRDGEYPAAWTRQHEERMKEAGLIMAEYQTQLTPTEDCLRLCNTMLTSEYPLPEGPLFQRDRLLQVLERVQFRNEARVFRDITPILVPSAELLHICGHAGLQHITEAINAEWQCDTLCGPRPKPDGAYGISPTAFTNDEREKLRMHHTSACPNLFAENMYYPFLICEVKGSDRSIQEAERQAMHSASIAARAVIQLYRKISSAHELHRKILAISVSHDNGMVKFTGHFARIDDEDVTFYRRSIYAAIFATNFASDDWAKPYKLTLAVYKLFYPQHLKRIKSALPKLRGRALESFTSQLGLDVAPDESVPEETPSAASQESGSMKRPSRQQSDGKLQQENNVLRNEILSMLREQKRQNGQQMEQKEQMERQLASQREEQREQKDMMERQLALQREEQRGQKDMMERQLVLQREQQREQKIMMERQVEQQKQIIDLLKQSKS